MNFNLRCLRDSAIALTVIAGSIIVPTAAVNALPTPTGSVSITAVGTFDGGGEAGSEIVAFDPVSERAFITNGLEESIDIVDFSVPSNPTLVRRVLIGEWGSDITSVAFRNGIVAAALPRDPSGVNTPTNGVVAFFDVNGNYVSQVPVGVLPDNVTFSKDGRTLVVAGEGEPVCDPGDNDPSLAQDPLGTVSIIDLSLGAAAATVSTLDFSAFSASSLLAENVRVYFPGSTAAQDLEPEYVAISPDGTRAWVTLQENNAMAIVDLTQRQIIDVVSFGYKDHSLAGNTLDVSDRDDGSNGPAVNIANWPTLGMYMPDGIAAFSTAEGEFVITANEGDSRDYSCYSEESRVASMDFTGSSISSSLLANAQMGRLTSTVAFPTASPITQIYSYGARSFSIWSADGTLVWDSGNDFETFIASVYPQLHNAQNGDVSAFDSRSDNKGPEPESVVVGKIGDRSYAFVGLERAGGMMVYDVTSPSAPVMVSYVNPQLEGGSGPGSSDTGPEGLAFVSGCETADGLARILVANEISGTTTMYIVDGAGDEVCVEPIPEVITAPSFTG